MIYLFGIYFSVLSAVNFADISSTCSSPRFNLWPVSKILNWTASIKFRKNIIQYSLLISKIVLLFTAKISNAWNSSKSFLSLLTRCIIYISLTICHCLRKFSVKNFPIRISPQKCGAKLATVTNQPDLRPTSYAYSQARHG